MTATRQSNLAVNALADALGVLLTGGALQFLTGDPPAQPDDASAESVLVQVDFGSFAPAEDGLIEYPFASIAVQADGTVGWWRALDADAAPLLDGPVYATEDPPVVGGIEVSSLTLSDGQVLTGTFRYQAPKAAA